MLFVDYSEPLACKGDWLPTVKHVAWMMNHGTPKLQRACHAALGKAVSNNKLEEGTHIPIAAFTTESAANVMMALRLLVSLRQGRLHACECGVVWQAAARIGIVTDGAAVVRVLEREQALLWFHRRFVQCLVLVRQLLEDAAAQSASLHLCFQHRLRGMLAEVRTMDGDDFGAETFCARAVVEVHNIMPMLPTVRQGRAVRQLQRALAQLRRTRPLALEPLRTRVYARVPIPTTTTTTATAPSPPQRRRSARSRAVACP
jgi:hypothetical protein